jgi:excisionase family DNA binding protein
MEELFTTQEVADALRLSEYKVRDMLRKGTIKGVKVDGQWRVRLSDYRQYLDSLEGRKKDK